jgi:hypothetical protein
MSDNTVKDTVKEMYKSAKDRFLELARQEIEIKEQLSHWATIVEQLAKVAGEELESEIAQRMKELKQESERTVGQEMGLIEAIRWVFRQGHILPLTPTKVRDELAAMGYDLDKYKHVMPPIHNTLNRMKEAGEIKEVEGLGGIGKAYVSAR